MNVLAVVKPIKSCKLFHNLWKKFVFRVTIRQFCMKDGWPQHIFFLFFSLFFSPFFGKYSVSAAHRKRTSVVIFPLFVFSFNFLMVA